MSEKLKSFVTVATMFVSSYTDYLLTNRAYLRTNFATERVQQYFNRVLVMVENTEGFEEGDSMLLQAAQIHKIQLTAQRLKIPRELKRVIR